MSLMKCGSRFAAFFLMLTAGLAVGLLPGPTQAQQLNTILQNLLQNAIQQNRQPASNSGRPTTPQNPYASPQPTHAPPPSAYQAPPTPTRPASSSEAGEHGTAAVQQMLNELGYDAGSADGFWGHRSDQAMRAFQADHSLVPDGRVTVMTEQAVRDVWAKRPSTPLHATATPSYSCKQASGQAELTICREQSLAVLDQQLADAYAAARTTAAGDAGAALLEQQKRWVRRRNICRANADCLHDMMTDRIAELQRTAPTLQAGASPETTNNQPQEGALENDPLASLEHPPSELRSWALDTLDGHLIISQQNRAPYTTSWNSAEGNRFFRLLADGSAPNGLEDEPDLGFLAEFFTKEAASKLFGAGQTWAGNNEIERAQSRDKFREHDAGVIRAMAPKLPLRLRWTERVLLGNYDPARGGFTVRPFGFGGSISRGELALLSSLQAGGLKPISSVDWPDLFWAVDQATAEQILRKWPDRWLNLFAVVQLGTIDPAVKELSVKLDQLVLYTPDFATKLHDYPLSPAASAPPQISPGPAVNTSGVTGMQVDVARQWKLPTLQGLPWIDGQNWNLELMPASGFNGDFGFNPTSSLRPLSTPELWTRAILALALAAIPDNAAITDSEAISLSCTLLSPAEQVRVFKQRSCGDELASPDNEFIARDGAAVFRAQEVPRIRAEAPHTPFQLLLVYPVMVGKYDSAHSGFSLGSPPGGELRLFNTPLDVPLPKFWPATDADARSFLAATHTTIGMRAWFGLKITIAAVVPGQTGPNAMATGLPNNATLRLRTEMVALYQDSGLRLLLHDFTQQSNRLPQPVLGTAQEQAPPPVDTMPANPETALMLLLHARTPLDTPVDWSTAAVVRQQSENTYRFSEDWQDFDPWGVFFPGTANAAASVNEYRRWTLARSAMLPQTLTLSRLVPTWPITAPLHVLTANSLGEFIGFGAAGTVSTSGNLQQVLLSRGIDPADVLQRSLSLAGNQRISVVFALPQAPDAYQVDTGSLLAVSPADAPQARLTVRSHIAGIEALPPDQYGRTTVIIRLVPNQVVIRRGTATLATLPLSGPDWQPAPTQTTVEQRLSGGPYGPDFLGIRLGMKIADAEALVRSAMHVTREVDTVPQPSHTGPITVAKQMLHGRLFLDDDAKQAIALFDAPKGAADRVVAAWRTAPVPVDAWDGLLPRLIAKYGQPTRTQVSPREVVWTNRFTSATTTGDCSRGLGDGQLTWKEGNQEKTPGGFSGWIGDFPTTPEVALHLDAFAGCGPALRVRNMLHAQGDPNAPLEMQLFDLGILSELSQSAAATPQPKPPPAIRF